MSAHHLEKDFRRRETDQARLYPCRKVAANPADWSEADWRAVPPAGSFILAAGTAPANLQTEVRAVWTDTALHVSFHCMDPEPWATMTRRDDSLYEEEVVEVFLATGEDPTRYFEFEINPLGTLFDAEIEWRGRGAIEVRREWDCAGLRGNVHPARDGWRAGLVIPFAGLRRMPAIGDEWAANFYRIERRPVCEFSSWAPLYTDPPEYHTPERFGRLLFTSGA